MSARRFRPLVLHLAAASAAGRPRSKPKRQFEPHHSNDPLCLRAVPGFFRGMGIYRTALHRVAKNTTGGAPALFVEVGAYLGQSSCCMSRFLEQRSRDASAANPVTFHVIDKWPPMADFARWADPQHIRLVNERGGGSWMRAWRYHMEAMAQRTGIKTTRIAKVTQASSVPAADAYADGSVSFVYLDTSHQYGLTMEELAAWWPKVRSDGGWLCGDDYDTPGVRRALADTFQPSGHGGRRRRGRVVPWTRGQYCVGKGVGAYEPAALSQLGNRSWTLNKC